MPQAIVYCDRCGRIIPPSEIGRGQAIIGGGGGICASCAGTLTPEQRAAVQAKLTGVAPVAPPPRPPTQAYSTAGLESRRPETTTLTRRMSARTTAIRAAQDEPTGGARKHLAIAGAAAGVVAGVAIALLVATGGDDGATSTVQPPATTTPTTTVTPPPPPGPSSASVQMSEVKTWAEDLPGRYHEIKKALKGIPFKYPGTPEAAEAEKLLEEYEARHSKLADAELAKAVEDAQGRVDAGMPEDAPRLIEDLRVRFAGTSWFEARGEKAIESASRRIAAAVEAARAAAVEAEARDAVASAERAARDGDAREAKRLLSARARWPASWRDRAEGILGKIAEEEARIAAEAEKERRRKEAWREFLVRMNAAGADGLRALETHFRESRAVLTELGKARELSRLERLLRQARGIEELAAIGFAGARGTIRLEWKGKPVGGRVVRVRDGVIRLKPPTVGDPVDVPLAELSPANVVDDSGIKPKPVDAAVYLMMRGDLDGARKRLADVGGDKARSLREEIDEIAAIVAPPPVEVAPAVVAVGPTEITDGLVAWYKFDEGDGSTAGDSSGAGRDGRIRGPSWTAGKIGGGLSFDGNDDYVELPTRLVGTDVGTVAMWIKATAGAGDRGILFYGSPAHDGDGYGDQLEFHLGLEQGRGITCFYMEGDPNTVSIRHGDGLADGTWHHVAATWDAAGDAVVYVDGVAGVSGRHGARGFDLSKIVRLGRPAKGPRAYAGAMDDIRVYGRALAADEVRSVCELGKMAGPPPEVTTGLVGWWKFDESRGDRATDSSGKSRHGMVRGAAWEPRGGKRGGALRFDGTTSQVILPRPVQDDFSLAFWVRTTQTSQNNPDWYNGRGLVDAEVGGTTTDFGTALVHEGFGFGTGGEGGEPETTVRSRRRINDGAWHHVAATREMASGKMKVYVDGDLDGEGTGSRRSLSRAGRMTVGCLQTNENFFEGLIDDVRAYDRALAGEEVRQIYAQNTLGAPAAPTAGLVARWTFEERAGAVARDSVGKGGGLALTGNVRWGTGRDGSGALDFGGTDGAAVSSATPSVLGIDGSRPRTVALWCYTRAFNEGGLFHTGSNTDGQGFLLWTQRTPNQWKADYYGEGRFFVFDTDTLRKWTHMAVTYDGARTVVYANGAPILERAIAVNTTNAIAFRLGVTLWAGAWNGAVNAYYDGIIDDVCIFNRALSGEEVKSLARSEGGAVAGGHVAGLFAEYFAGKDPATGQRRATQVVPTVDFSWGGGKPHPDAPADEFSCRFSGELRVPEDGRYEFIIDADDTAKLWIGDVDGRPKIDKGWGAASVALNLKAGWTPIRVDFMEGGGTATCKLSWQGPGVPRGPVAAEFLRTDAARAGAIAGATPTQPITTTPKEWTGKYVAGLRATYYLAKEIGPAVPSVERIDPNIDFGWGESPGMGVPRDNFAVRWVGEIQIPADGRYNFEVEHDDGTVLVIGGRRLIDRWNNGGNDRKDIDLKRGWVPIEVLFNEAGGGAHARLRWTGPGIAKAIVPASRFRTPDVKAMASAVGKGPGGPKEPLPGETGEPGDVAPGVICEIFRGVTFLDRVGVRIDPQIDFHFENAPPDLGLPDDTYTFRWRGLLLAYYDGLFKFESENLLVKIDGKSVPNKDILMEKGLHRFEAIGKTGPSQRGGVRFRWKPPGAGTRAVPSSHLYHEVPALGSMGPFAKAVPGLGAKFYGTETPKGRALESSVRDAEFDLDELPPCSMISKDQFSVRLEGHILARKAGKFIFKLEADDGAQFLIDNDLKIDGWKHMPEEPTAEVQFKAGYHRITVLHRDRNSRARLKLLWRPPWGSDDQGKPKFERIQANCLFREPGKPNLVGRKGLSPGIKCVMYEGERPGAGKKVFERLDPGLWFDWGGEIPGPEVPIKNFSAAWKGLLVVPKSGTYFFRAWRRGGVVLTVGSTTVVKDWKDNEAWEDGRPVKLRAGTAPILLTYFNREDRPAVKVYWSGPDFMLREMGAGDLVHKTKELELAAAWRDPAEPVAVAPGPTKPGDPVPGGTGPALPGGGTGVTPLPVGNLVANGGFEEKDAERKFAARWAKGQWGSRGARYSVRVDMSNPHEGGESALVARALAGGAKAGASTTLKLEPGTFTVSYWACANVGDTATIGAHFAGSELPESSVGDKWKRFTHQAKVDAKTSNGALRVWTSTPNVRVWFDDVEVVMTKRAEPKTD